MGDRVRHVLLDVTAAQGGFPSVRVVRWGSTRVVEGPVTLEEALLLSDDLRRAAEAGQELHRRYADDRDLAHQARRKAPTEGDGGT